MEFTSAIVDNLKDIPFDTGILANNALRKATQVRTDLGLNQLDPVCIYSICDKLGISVRFVDINMDGMYSRIPKPTIFISSLRPLVRRNMTCAHELGHHLFGHGASIDELEATASHQSHLSPEEFLVDRFASSLLMPTLGIRQAVNMRGIPAPDKIWAVASDYMVGYSSLLYHLYYALGTLSWSQFLSFKKVTPQALRAEALGFLSKEPAVLIDSNSIAKSIDVETSSWIVSTSELCFQSDLLSAGQKVPAGHAYQVIKQGIIRINSVSTGLSFFIRASRKAERDKGYVGLAKYRHLSED